jgi:hypothetical protein
MVAGSLHAAAAAQSTSAGQPVDVMVVGSPHLRQLGPAAVPVATAQIRASLSRFRPDHIVVEWLHPSIPAESTFNYRPLDDLPTLARLWGYRLDRVPGELDSLERAVLGGGLSGPVLGALRIELGKLYYLSRNQANAAYQWWQAERLGVATGSLKRLSANNLDGHEAAEVGFAVGAAHGARVLTAFDYQGPEAGTLVWGEMLERLRELAIAGRGGSSAVFDSLRRRYEDQRDSTWLRRYGDLPEVRQYNSVLDGFAWAAAQEPKGADGLTLVRWLNSRAYELVERRVQLEIIPGITFGGFGAARLQGIMGRNRRMVDFVEADVQRFGTRRVMIVVGAAHKFALEDILRERGYRVVPAAEFLP